MTATFFLQATVMSSNADVTTKPGSDVGVVLGAMSSVMLLFAFIQCCVLLGLGYGAYQVAKGSGAKGSTPMMVAIVTVCCCCVVSGVGNAVFDPRKRNNPETAFKF